MSKSVWKWFYTCIAPTSLVTAVLSFLRSGDTFVDPIPYLLFSLTNSGLFFYFLMLGNAISKENTWARKWKYYSLVIVASTSTIAYVYIYSLIF